MPTSTACPASAELAELGFDDLPEDAVVVVEWPDRAAGFLPPDRIDVTLTLAPKLKPEFRHARVTGYGTCAPRVDRIAAVRQFIAEAGLSEATRERMPGDASTRRYHRLLLGNRRAILMDSPRRPDGPPVKDGKPYSQIAHLAEIGGAVRRHGEGAARAGPVRARDPARRHRSRACWSSRTSATKAWSRAIRRRRSSERYETAVDVLLALHDKQAAGGAAGRAACGASRSRPTTWTRYLIEVELLLEWYLPRLGIVVTDDARAEFFAHLARGACSR